MEKKGYFESLDPPDKAVYREKCTVIILIGRNELSADPGDLPAITHGDIVHYLVFSPNPLYTLGEMRAFKGLDAHNQFTSGWVRDIAVKCVQDDIAVIRGRVSKQINVLFKK